MSTSRHVAAACSAATLMVAAGCYSYQRAETGPIGSDADVRIRFASPQNVAVSSTASGPIVLTGVERLGGRVLSTSGDSVRIHVTTATDQTGQRLAVATDATTWIVRGPATQVNVYRLSKGRSALLGGGVVGVALLLATAIATVIAIASLAGS
jgi:hypothetical protein